MEAIDDEVIGDEIVGGVFKLLESLGARRWFHPTTTF